MNCPGCGVALPKGLRVRPGDVITCGICKKQCTAEQAVQFGRDPQLDHDEPEEWQR